jgi:hypothetical protein
MIAGMRLAQKIAGTDPLKRKVIKTLKPGDDLEVARGHCGSSKAIEGLCRMNVAS